MDRRPLHEASVVELNPFYLLRWEEAQKAYVLLYPEGLVKLNDTASEILRLVTGDATVEDIIGQLTTKYEDQGIAADVREFLEVSYAQNWIRTKP